METHAPTTPGLERLIAALGAALGDGAGGAAPTAETSRAVQAALHEAIDDPDLLPDAISSSPSLPPLSLQKYLLHSEPGFVAFCVVTAPRYAPLAHDHGAWGVVGVYRGVEEEICYVPVALPGRPDLVGLAEGRRRLHSKGDLMLVSPPRRDIHRVSNRGDHNSITIHVFTHDVVSTGFRIYPPAHLPVDTGSLEYDEVPAWPAT